MHHARALITSVSMILRSTVQRFFLTLKKSHKPEIFVFFEKIRHFLIILYRISPYKLFEILRSFLRVLIPMTRTFICHRPPDTLSGLEAMTALKNYILDVRAWMRKDMLWLNDEIIIINVVVVVVIIIIIIKANLEYY